MCTPLLTSERVMYVELQKGLGCVNVMNVVDAYLLLNATIAPYVLLRSYD